MRLIKSNKSPVAADELPIPRETAQPFYQTVEEVIERMEYLHNMGTDARERQLGTWFTVSYYAMAMQCYDQHLDMCKNGADTDLMSRLMNLVYVISHDISMALPKDQYAHELRIALLMALHNGPRNPGLDIDAANLSLRMGKTEEAKERLQTAQEYTFKPEEEYLRDVISIMLDNIEQQTTRANDNKVFIEAKIAKDETFKKFPIKMVWDQQLGAGRPHNIGGRKMVASKDIPRGTVLLRVAPFASTILDECFKYLCMACFQQKKSIDTYVCPKCKGILCRMCHKDKVAQEEHNAMCTFLLPGSLPTETEDKSIINVESRLAIHTVLRAIQNIEGKASKQNTLAAWRKDGLPFIYDTLQDMDKICLEAVDHYEEHDVLKLHNWQEVLTECIKRLKGPSFLASLPEQFIAKMLRKLGPNNIPLMFVTTNSALAFGIFPSASLINNACMPNTYSYMDNYGMLVYRSNRAIKAGEEITQSILNPLATSSERRGRLLTDYYQYCQCDYCTNVENSQYQCPKCGQALDESNRRTWQPQPSIDFDGQVYVCNKGHVTMATLYDILVLVGGNEDYENTLELYQSHFEATMRQYFQPNGLLMVNYENDLAVAKASSGQVSKARESFKRVIQCFEAVFGRDAKFTVPFLYSRIYLSQLTMVSFDDKKKNNKEVVADKKRLREHLESTINLSTHCSREYLNYLLD
ncbi:hypothetical protein SAMD00019534_049310 [Acytostelium subglobosum LB1]|uniref:hypothetical protein n=1 Tax=Acytostelium subglobosum LB1 TaxID=1410327 RepID=UPI0006449990|nr:hypothetical protein SAMD00019534_049310 [Acytostelium subglobosum LB1]GAM21756.1 hypothetical protein SAMD00019534_049310 [Acytostelium subglobosum LB1]|eukprot:XP_012754856.1 hypothetical protein SAMD00019534_049310 [Acytostelium subglobosum LB1]